LPSDPATSSTDALATAGAAAAARALEWVKDGATLGLGTGRAAEAFVRALGARCAEGLRVTGVPTSDRTAALARELDIPLTTLDAAGRLDVTFDGADEVDPQLDLIKGYGAAMVREKIVAESSDRLVILVGPEKRVAKLGERGRLPVEVVPFGVAFVGRVLSKLGIPGELRRSADGEPVLTDNGNPILDARVQAIDDPAGLDARLTSLPGVVGTGLFIGLASAVIIDDAGRIEVLERRA